MVINKYTVAAAFVILVVIASYVVNFYFLHDYSISSDTAVWGQLGDYTGGLLNPILSFIALILLIKSLNLQNEANKSLKSELTNSQKTESIRSFEALFFNMIDSQKNLFDSFKIDLTKEGSIITKIGVDAVIEIEDEITNIRNDGGKDEDITKFLEEIDSKEKIFGLTRSFYIMVKMISDKLSNEQGFNVDDRFTHLLTLINFTDFSQLRLIMIALQFMNYHSVDYLKNNSEFNEVLEEIGLGYNLY